MNPQQSFRSKFDGCHGMLESKIYQSFALHFQLAINPEFKVAEKTFDNNAAACEMIYGHQDVWIGNCTLVRP